MEEGEKWRIAEEYLDKLSEEEAKFIHEYSEKLLKDVITISDTIVTRTSILISVTVAVMIALIGYSIPHWETIHKFDSKLYASSIVILYLFILCIMLIMNVQPKNYYTVGVEPKILFAKNFFDDSVAETDRQLFFYVNEIESYQERIEKNKTTNESRWKLYNVSLWLVGLTPALLIVVYLIANLFSCSL
jgi:hypothetical protein